MHFLLVGPGALGCLVSCVVTKGMGDRDRLTLLDYNADRANRLTQEGIVYHLGEQQVHFPVTAISDPQVLDPVDVVLLCVKSYDVINSLGFCKSILSENTLLVFLQNGIGHLDVKDYQHKATAAFGTTTEGATLLGPGQVRHAGSGVTYLGFLAPPENQAAKLLQNTHTIFSAGGMETHLADNIVTRLWAKLFVNVGINALTAILGCNNGALLTLPGIDKRMKAAVEEAVQIAEKKNIPIMDDPYEATRMVCSRTAKNISSMLQDVRKKRRTEIDAINGAVVALGHIMGIDTAENYRLCRQIKELETSYVR